MPALAKDGMLVSSPIAQQYKDSRHAEDVSIIFLKLHQSSQTADTMPCRRQGLELGMLAYSNGA